MELKYVFFLFSCLVTFNVVSAEIDLTDIFKIQGFDTKATSMESELEKLLQGKDDNAKSEIISTLITNLAKGLKRAGGIWVFAYGTKFKKEVLQKSIELIEKYITEEIGSYTVNIQLDPGTKNPSAKTEDEPEDAQLPRQTSFSIKEWIEFLKYYDQVHKTKGLTEIFYVLNPVKIGIDFNKDLRDKARKTAEEKAEEEPKEEAKAEEKPKEEPKEEEVIDTPKLTHLTKDRSKPKGKRKPTQKKPQIETHKETPPGRPAFVHELYYLSDLNATEKLIYFGIKKLDEKTSITKLLNLLEKITKEYFDKIPDDAKTLFQQIEEKKSKLANTQEIKEAEMLKRLMQEANNKEFLWTKDQLEKISSWLESAKKNFEELEKKEKKREAEQKAQAEQQLIEQEAAEKTAKEEKVKQTLEKISSSGDTEISFGQQKGKICDRPPTASLVRFKAAIISKNLNFTQELRDLSENLEILQKLIPEAISLDTLGKIHQTLINVCGNDYKDPLKETIEKLLPKPKPIAREMTPKKPLPTQQKKAADPKKEMSFLQDLKQNLVKLKNNLAKLLDSLEMLKTKLQTKGIK